MTGYWAILTGAVAGLVVGGCATAPAVQLYQTKATQHSNTLEHARAANDQGLAFAQSEQWESAGSSFRTALTHDSAFAAAHNNLGLVLLAQSKYYESAHEFAQASSLSPRSVEPLINLGRLYETIGWTKEAIAQYEKVLQAEPQNERAIARLARLQPSFHQEIVAGESPRYLTDADEFNDGNSTSARAELKVALPGDR